MRKTHQPLAFTHVYAHACTHIDMHLYKHINHTDSTTQIHIPKNDLILFLNMPLGCELEGNTGLGSFATCLISDLIFVKSQSKSLIKTQSNLNSFSSVNVNFFRRKKIFKTIRLVLPQKKCELRIMYLFLTKQFQTYLKKVLVSLPKLAIV